MTANCCDKQSCLKKHRWHRRALDTKFVGLAPISNNYAVPITMNVTDYSSMNIFVQTKVRDTPTSIMIFLIIFILFTDILWMCVC
jgi:hypothetical protein